VLPLGIKIYPFEVVGGDPQDQGPAAAFSAHQLILIGSFQCGGAEVGAGSRYGASATRVSSEEKKNPESSFEILYEV
jgi:hypothetical protein